MQQIIIACFFCFIIGFTSAQQSLFLRPTMMREVMEQRPMGPSNYDAVLQSFYRARRQDEGYQQLKKAFVRPCVYNMGSCITSTQQQRLLQHMRSLVELKTRD